MASKKLSFEEALKQLESIAQQIEQGKVGLEESIEKYEQAMTLLKHCREILGKAELRIQQLHERPDGSLQPAPFTRPSDTKEA